jgi:hypothetical protein
LIRYVDYFRLRRDECEEIDIPYIWDLSYDEDNLWEIYSPWEKLDFNVNI